MLKSFLLYNYSKPSLKTPVKRTRNQKQYTIFHRSSLPGNLDYAIRLFGIASEVAATQLLVDASCVARNEDLLMEKLRKDSALGRLIRQALATSTGLIGTALLLKTLEGGHKS